MRDPQHRELYRAIGRWARYVLLPRAIPGGIPLPNTEDLTEINDMTTTISYSRDWTLKYRMEGREEGQSQFLEQLLTRKFCPLPDETRQRLSGANRSQLEAWAMNILDADSLQEVFRD